MEVTRISPQEARQKVSSGQALLVCAYDSPEKCNRFHLEGAITLDDLKTQSSAQGKELIFY